MNFEAKKESNSKNDFINFSQKKTSRIKNKKTTKIFTYFPDWKIWTQKNLQQNLRVKLRDLKTETFKKNSTKKFLQIYKKKFFNYPIFLRCRLTS